MHAGLGGTISSAEVAGRVREAVRVRPARGRPNGGRMGRVVVATDCGKSLGSSTPSIMQDSPEASTMGQTTREGMKWGVLPGGWETKR